MLPFLKTKPQTGVIIKEFKTNSESEKSESEQGLKFCAQELIKAVHMQDEDGVMKALKSAFEILDSQPHEEGPHLNETEEE